MEFTLTQDFPAGLAELWAAFGRPEYPQAKYLALGATAVRMRRFQASAQMIEVDLERDVTVDRSQFPGWMRWLTRDRQTLRHRSTWRRLGPKHGVVELDIQPVGLPLRAHGNGSLAEQGVETTRMRLSWRVSSTLGARVESLFAEQIRAALDEDHAFTLQYLRRTKVE